MVLYAGACIVLTGMVHYTRINPDSGFSSAFSSVGMPAVGSVIAVGAILGIVTVCFSFMLGASRLWYALSRDGLMPRWFGELHPRRRVPHRATWVLGIVAAVLAGLLPVKEAAQLTNIGILFAFVLVCVAVVVLRYRRPDLPRAFRCPGMPVVPVLGVVFSVWLMTFLNGTTWLRLGIWMVIGLAIYISWGYRNTRRVNPGGSVDLSSVSEA
jgi:APA family basic amino acid/polyamine antiporter